MRWRVARLTENRPHRYRKSESVSENLNISVPRCSEELGLSQMTTWRILHHDLRLKVYKVQLTQALEPSEKNQIKHISFLMNLRIMEILFLCLFIMKKSPFGVVFGFKTLPYFFEYGVGNLVTVDGERYWNMLPEYYWPKLLNFDEANVFFQRDSEACHTSRPAITLLYEKFSGKVCNF